MYVQEFSYVVSEPKRINSLSEGPFTFLHLLSCLLVRHGSVRCHSHGKGLPQKNTKAPDVTFCGITTWKHQQGAALTKPRVSQVFIEESESLEEYFYLWLQGSCGLP